MAIIPSMNFNVHYISKLKSKIFLSIQDVIIVPLDGKL